MIPRKHQREAGLSAASAGVSCICGGRGGPTLMTKGSQWGSAKQNAFRPNPDEMSMSWGQRATARGKWGKFLPGGMSQLGVQMESAWASLCCCFHAVPYGGFRSPMHRYTTLTHPPAPPRAEMMVQGDRDRATCVITSHDSQIGPSPISLRAGDT